MKKLCLFAVAVLTALALAACSGVSGSRTGSEAIAPYVLSKQETTLINLLGLQSDVSLFTFKAPRDARRMSVSVYTLGPDAAWELTGDTAMMLDEAEAADNRLEGTLALLRERDRSLSIHVQALGSFSYRTEPPAIEQEISAYGNTALTQPAPITLGQEVPVAIYLYTSGSQIRSQSVERFFTPADFEGMDCVQAVTLRFDAA